VEDFMPQAQQRFHRRQPRVALFLLESKKEILLGVARYVRQYGPWRLFLQPTADSEGMPQWLARWQGDGIIGRIISRETADLILGTGLPFVDVRGKIRDERIPLLRVDDEAVGRQAAAHLVERGFRNFGFYGVEGENYSKLRWEGFERAIAREGSGLRNRGSGGNGEGSDEAGKESETGHPAPSAQQRSSNRSQNPEPRAGYPVSCLEQPWAMAGATGWDQAEKELTEWLRALPKPAGVLAANDRLGQRLLTAARRGGIRVPEELAVVGVDDERGTCEICDPPLSSVIIDSEQHGYKAAELLDRLMRGESSPVEPLLLQPAGVRVRQSTEILAIDDPFIADAVRFIRENACEGIGVSDVLKVVPLSRSVLQRQFRRIFGQTANDMIVQMRLKRAQELLVESDLPIARIAEMAGFRYQRYLGAVFRKKLGMTPFEYRRQAGPGRHLEAAEA
jgi:LacI family transcriptional regulator